MAKNTLKGRNNGFIQKGKLDITFLSFVLILLTIGLVMLFSASYAYFMKITATVTNLL